MKKVIKRKKTPGKFNDTNAAKIRKILGMKPDQSLIVVGKHGAKSELSGGIFDGEFNDLLELSEVIMKTLLLGGLDSLSIPKKKRK